LNPRLQGKAIDWQGFARTSKAAQQLAQVGLRAPSFPLFLHLLIGKLPPRDRQAVCDRLRLAKAERNLPQKLETEAKKLAKEIGGKPGNSPSRLFDLLAKTPPDVLLLLLSNFPQKTVQGRLKAYFSKYLPLHANLPARELEQLGVKPGTPRSQKILDSYFHAALEGKLRTPNQQQKYLARLVQEVK
jgi:hypothetical protein